jgi:phage-related protein (TIGR01555 family)
MWLLDNFTNFITGLGTSKDPTTATTYVYQELDRNQLEQAYRGNWIARRVINAPAEDATVEWRHWNAARDDIDTIEELEKTLSIQRKMKQALTRARLYGGAALVMGVDQGNTDEPLDLDAVGEGDLKWVVVMNRYELSAGPRIFDVESPWYTRPEYYTVSTPTVGLDNRSKGREVMGMARMHPSRVIEFHGNELPDWRLAPMGGGWGDSVLQAMDETLKDWGMTLGGIANMVNDAKMDVIKLPNFSKLIVEEKYRNNLFKRFSAANQAKSTINSLIMDKDEEWERISTSFAGLPQILMALMPIVSAAGGIPVSRLMGQAPGKGLSQATSGGESDLYNYYDEISAQQKTEYSPALVPLDQCLIRSAIGDYDPSIYYDWAPLYKPDPKDVSAVQYQKAQMTQIYVNTGLINEDAMRQAVVNQMIEDGTYVGLDDAIDEHGIEPPQPTPEEMAAHAALLSKSAVANTKP